MGNDIQAGHEYSDASPLWTVNGQNLNAHVNDAVIKSTFISARTELTPLTLSPEIVINDAGTLKKATLQALHDLLIYPGAVIQMQKAVYTANTALTATIPSDDTIPQSTEGTEILSVSITPRFATSEMVITFEAEVAAGGSSATSIVAALFKNAETAAFCARSVNHPALSNFKISIALRAFDLPASTSAQAYKLRIGPNAAEAIRLNGDTSGREMGGMQQATLTVMEVRV